MTKKYCPKCNRSDQLVHWKSNPGLDVAQCGCKWYGSVNLLLKEPRLPMIAPKLKYVSIDIETTGLNPDTCQVLELGAVIEDWISPIDKLPTFRRILFNKPIVGEPFALALNANLLKLIANPPTELEYLFVKPDDLGYDFANWLSQNNIDPKHIQPAGKNFAAFDAQFLNRLSRFNEYVKFNHRTIDPSMLFWHLDDEGLPGTKECMERAGIDGKVAHTAVEDAIAVIKMVRYWANTQ